MVPRHVVCLGGDKGWLVWSPYFEHKWHLFLRSHLKEKVFKNYPHNLAELRDRNIEEVNSIPRYICNGAIQIFWKHLQQNFETERHHSRDITFQTRFYIQYFRLVIIAPQNCVVRSATLVTISFISWNSSLVLSTSENRFDILTRWSALWTSSA